MQVTLEVIGKKSNVKRVILNESTLIGRGGECNLKIVSSQVSRKHCRIEIEPNRVTVCDLGSANGTFINNSQISPDERVEISSGTTLRLGNVNFRLQFKRNENDPAFEGESSTVELAAYKDAENLEQVEKRISAEETPDAQEANIKQADAGNPFEMIEIVERGEGDEEMIDISTANIPAEEPKSVILEAVEIDDAIPDVIIEEDDSQIDAPEVQEPVVQEEDVIELEAIEPKPVESKPVEIEAVEAEVSEDDIADFLSDLDAPDESNDNNPTDLKNFLDQFE